MKQGLVNLRHDRSSKDFPNLNLVADEYVELAITRSRIGIIFIWTAVAAIFVVLTAALFTLLTTEASESIVNLNPTAKSYLYFIIIILYIFIFVAGLVSATVYNRNKLFITNKRIFHFSANSLFSQSNSVIDLVSIEDVSFIQAGLADYIFKIGTIRLSTVGDETTYTFKYIDTPHDELKVILDLVHINKDKDSTEETQ